MALKGDKRLMGAGGFWLRRSALGDSFLATQSRQRHLNFMKQFKYKRKVTLDASGPIENVRWTVPPSRHYRLVVNNDGRSVWIEYNDAKRLPTIKIVGNGKRAQKKL